MKCPKCDGTGQIELELRIPLWHEQGKRISFVDIDDAGDNDQVREIGHEFAKFIKAHAHGGFHDGLKAELNRD